MRPFLKLTLAAVCSLGAAATHADPLQITVATFPDLDRAARAAVPEWNKLHPEIAVKVVSLQYPDHHVAMTTALATRSGLPDVMAVDLRFIGKFAESGGLEDLAKPPYNALALRDRFVRYTFAQATSSAGALAAMPTDIGPGTLLYRKDILDKAGVSEAELTQSWESFIEAGKKIKAKTGAYLMSDAGDLRDIVLRSGLQDGEGLYFNAQGKPVLNSPRFVRAFELGRAARQAGLDGKAPAWSNAWTAGFKHNSFATQMMGAWLTGHLKNWLAPDNAGLWRATGLPGGLAASYGGSFYAIPSMAPNKAAAWQFILFMTNRAETQINSLKVLDAFPALIEAQHGPLMDEPIAYLGGQKARLLWRDIAAKVPAIPVNKHDSMATDVLRAEFENVVSQGKPIPQALADAQQLLERRSRR
jgi:multiple sugar transport system substrate-binding protein